MDFNSSGFKALNSICKFRKNTNMHISGSCHCPTWKINKRKQKTRQPSNGIPMIFYFQYGNNISKPTWHGHLCFFSHLELVSHNIKTQFLHFEIPIETSKHLFTFKAPEPKILSAKRENCQAKILNLKPTPKFVQVRGWWSGDRVPLINQMRTSNVHGRSAVQKGAASNSINSSFIIRSTLAFRNSVCCLCWLIWLFMHTVFGCEYMWCTYCHYWRRAIA